MRARCADNARMTSAPPNTPRRTEDFAVGTLRIVIHGARGRMGGRIAACAEADAACTVAQRIDRGDALAVRAGDVDAVLDFSSSDGASCAADVAEALGCALLVGTTGLADGALAAIDRAARRIPVMVAPNTALGVAVARRLAAEAARLLPGFDVDILETHHVRKLDAPSGTARSLAEAVSRGRGEPLDPARIHSVRAGDVVGDHEVAFSGPGERVSVVHRATSRDLFALGAIRMARWLATRPAGRHAPDAWFDDLVRGHG
jgi:4-hydroxy-tetrahydrodipicolinate reductase